MSTEDSPTKPASTKPRLEFHMILFDVEHALLEGLRRPEETRNAAIRRLIREAWDRKVAERERRRPSGRETSTCTLPREGRRGYLDAGYNARRNYQNATGRSPEET